MNACYPIHWSHRPSVLQHTGNLWPLPDFPCSYLSGGTDLTVQWCTLPKHVLCFFSCQENAHQCRDQGKWCQTHKAPFKGVDGHAHDGGFQSLRQGDEQIGIRDGQSSVPAGNRLLGGGSNSPAQEPTKACSCALHSMIVVIARI